jgi:kynurenine formamidase
MEDLKKALESAPKNWGKWGDNDEVGALNYLGNKEVMDGIRSVKKGKTFSLGLEVSKPGGDIVFPGRSSTIHLMTQDEGTYNAGKTQPLPGGLKFADDLVIMYLQGTTQCDAIGHAWYGHTLYNNYPAETTSGGLSRASILPIGKKGIVGRGILLDVPRYRGVDYLEKGEAISYKDINETMKLEKIEIKKHDIVLIRTGHIKVFYEKGPEIYFNPLNEPGITYERELIDWFYKNEVSAYGADTLSSELTNSTTTGTMVPMHIFLMNYLGIPIQELLWLEDLANDCKADGQYEFLYIASPLKIHGGTGSPINPIVIK